MQTSRSAKFTIKLNSDILFELLQRIAVRAYELGFEDAQAGREADPETRAKIDPTHLRRFV